MTYQLIIIRHASPESQTLNQDEKLRPLSKRGIKELQHLSEQLKQAGLLRGLCLHSPILRAKQSAEELNKHLQLDLEKSNYLSYAFDPESIIQKIKDLNPSFPVFLVGHNPSLSDWVCQLLEQPSSAIGLAPADCIVLCFESFDKPFTAKLLHYFPANS